jgi:predicted nucleotidyltransferase component of viral defense system
MNVAASVRQRLLNLAYESGRPFNEILQFYAMERFLYRLSVSEHKKKLILKGALMLVAWQAPSSRPTTDIDFLGKFSNSPEIIMLMVQDICETSVEDDGIVFNTDSISAESIDEDADYRGIRVRFTGKLDTARVVMQLDIGFGDILIPKAEMLKYPTLLNMPQPILKSYSRESSVAEKLEAMVKLGVANSRMKDFYDTWYLSHWFEFDGSILANAILATFKRRGTPLIDLPAVFTSDFTGNTQKQIQWKAFIEKNRLKDAPLTINEVVGEIQSFISPILTALIKKSQVQILWSAVNLKWNQKV